jgi:hypothetical protein
MRTKTIVTLFAICSLASACGGNSGDGADARDIAVTDTKTGPDATDLPNFDFIEANVGEIKCGENDISEDGYLTIQCLDKTDEPAVEAYAACNAGDIVVEINGGDVFSFPSTTCLKALCSNNGNNMTFADC